ncbi:cadherin-related family member 5 isoform X2 [Centropristis striata]|uniref:cadherin-related family member 5 isoform X2 n=1 Tax=Centropristis striata TaxID=184440 RepID=UPI0027DFD716|nr:cadherin-related family member 5 isoform X2 [Centropristis striata]
MVSVSVIAFSFLLTTALSDTVKADEFKTLLNKEDFHIELTSPLIEIKFRGSAQRSPVVTLWQSGKVIGSRAKLNKGLSHLVIDNVAEEDEGTYFIKDPENEKNNRNITLVVRDCTVEDIVKYGDNYHIQLLRVTPPITLEYKPSTVEANQTARPALVLYTSSGMSREGYQGRIHVSERQVILSAVTGADEGSYTVRDGEGVIQRKNCLNVKEHQNFVILSSGKKLKINLILNSSLVQLYYTPENGDKNYLLLDKGVFKTDETGLDLEDRISLEGPWVILSQINEADVGQYKVTDILGFTVSSTHVKLEPYKLESLYVAIIALVGLLVFLLLVCLLSCLIKVKKRAKRAAALEKIAQNAGKEDEGEAFREVVKNITKLSEESKHSQADNTEKSQSTEGLEVSSKEVGVGNLETSDSGVGFNTALPLDTDTDAADQNLDSVAVSISVASEPKASPPSTAAAASAAAAAESESKPSAPPALEIKSSPVAETKTSPAPETKKTPDQPVEVKLDVPKPADAKLSPASSPKAGLSPADPKPAPTPSPEPKPAAPKAPTPTPESKSALTPTPETPKPTTPEPITNGTPEPGPDSKSSPDHADVIGAPKAAPAKTPEVELKSAALEASKDSAVAEDSTTTT